jgi:hypothetical protein
MLPARILVLAGLLGFCSSASAQPGTPVEPGADRREIPTRVHVWRHVDLDAEVIYRMVRDTLALRYRSFDGDQLQRMPGDSASYASGMALEEVLINDEALGVSSGNRLRLTYRMHAAISDGSAAGPADTGEVRATLVALQLLYEPRTDAPRVPLLFITHRHPDWEALMTPRFTVPSNCCSLHRTSFREALRLRRTVPVYSHDRNWMVVDGCGAEPVRVSHTGTDGRHRDPCTTGWLRSLSSTSSGAE